MLDVQSSIIIIIIISIIIIITTQNRRPNNIQKTLPQIQVTKLKLKVYLLLG